MMSQSKTLMRLTAFFGAASLALLSSASAQNNRPAPGNYQGRGVAQGSAFTRGRTVTVALTIDRDNFSLNLSEPSNRGARVQYRGVISRRNNEANNPNSFTLDTRVRSFDSSLNLRVLPNTTGTCRIEVFDARIVSSTCTTVVKDSATRFLGLEQF